MVGTVGGMGLVVGGTAVEVKWPWGWLSWFLPRGPTGLFR